ncbi:Fis family transcriptional regulator [Paraburkholderia bryophila]|uniref:Uncharacterized protein n=1 Tax=Paraburkholderia bryophila TaxID=420952 RepID=A0A7Y9WPQ0_9BURK|nr:Fis family transcriptional regulator [Paraburkholderia bryophila]NYH24880.1 hypothetical protein [Paraburkholderia bryophila]
MSHTNMANRRKIADRSFANHTKRAQTKAMLLPMNVVMARQVSLENHLSLETLRSGVAGEHQFNGICQAYCIARFLHEAGYGGSRDNLFEEAERVLLHCRATADKTGDWWFDDEACRILAEIVTLHDAQCAVAPVHALICANERLKTR